MSVLDSIIGSKRLPVLFIGSGIPKRYLRKYPDWNGLLEQSFAFCNPDPFQYQKYIDYYKRQGMSQFEININLASTIENEFNTAFFDRKIKLHIGNSKNPAWVKKGISPYKMYLANFFKKMSLTRDPLLLAEIEKFKTLKSRTSAVITTNYDVFLEKYIFPDDFSVFSRQDELFGADSYNIAEIYKIHGSANDAESIVITKTDYDRFQETRKLIIAKMLTLFSESPIIFMGYSFTDENVRSIITDFLSCLSPEQLQHIDEHFLFISYRKNEESLNETQRTIITQDGAEIPLTEIRTDNYSSLFDMLAQITPGISPVRVREARRVIKTIVDESIASENAESIIVGLDDLSTLDLSSKPLAIAIGYKESILSKIGYGLIDDGIILEDILYDNKHLNCDAMCTDRFKSLPVTRLIPVFKYVQGCTTGINPESKLYAYMEKHSSIDQIVSKTASKPLQNIPLFSDYECLKAAINEEPVIHKKAGILLKNIQMLSICQIREQCMIIFNQDRSASCKSTNFKRCVMCLDLFENHSEQKES